MRKILLCTSAAFLIGLGATWAQAVTSTVGQPPIPSRGPGLVDGTWLNGLAGGQNQLYINGLTALGTNQATGYAIASGLALIGFASVPSGTGADMPTALPGTCVIVFNHDSANTLTLYANLRNNPVTGSQDQFSSGSGLGSSATIAHGLSTRFCSVAAGIWN